MRFLASMAVMLSVGLAQAGIIVTNVVATPRWPWSGKVDIAYEVLADDPQANLWVSFSGLDKDRNLSVPVITLAGDGADGRVKPGKRRVTWDAAADSPGKNAAAFVVSVAVSVDEKYMVIDLSGGTAAASYPVTYLGNVPAGGWTDEYKTSKLVMRKIEPDTFTMGSPAGELGRYSDETQHAVTLSKSYYIGVFEVTQRQWELVMGNNPSYFTNDTCYATRPVEQVSYFDIREDSANAHDPSADWPANSVVNAASFMGKMRAKTGLAAFDLPTESQWEYACRAGTVTALNSGKNLTNVNLEQPDANMSEVGRYLGGPAYSPSSVPGVAGTAAAGSYLPNELGLYDMHGNVWEWCLDWYGTYPGASSDPEGAASGSDRVFRGGSWNTSANFCRSADRYGNGPNLRFISIGFRAAHTLP